MGYGRVRWTLIFVLVFLFQSVAFVSTATSQVADLVSPERCRSERYRNQTCHRDQTLQAPYRELIVNGGFEQGTTGWRAVTAPGGSFTTTQEQPHDGSKSAALTPPPEGQITVSQLISASENVEYTLSGYVLWQHAYDSVELQLRWLFPNKQPSVESRSPTQQGEWQKLEVAGLRTPEGATHMQIALHATSGDQDQTGAELFDDISLLERPVPTPTPTPTSTPVPTPTVYLNEALSNPRETDWNGDGSRDSQDEWVELYIGSDQDANLKGWWLEDDTGEAGRYVIPGLRTAAHSYFILYSRETRLQLNNDGDTVRLFRPDGTLADELTVPPLQADRSVSRYPDGAVSTSTEWQPTPGKPNGSLGLAPTPTPEPSSTPRPTPTGTPKPTGTPRPTHSPTPTPIPRSVTIAGARKAPAGETVQVRGSVTAPSHLVGARRLYIQDHTAGILIVVPEETPAYEPGDLLEVTAVTGTYFGERSLRPHDGGVALLQAADEPAPRHIHTGDVGPATEGLLVQVEGDVTRVSKPSVRLDDGTGEARVRVSDSTGISWPSPHKDDKLSATGVISSFNGSYRILPRYERDLSLERQAPPTPTDTPSPTATGEPAPAAQAVTIREARTSKEGLLVNVRGRVTSPPNLVGSRRMYIQDSAAGILVIVPEELRRFDTGDTLGVTGVTGTYFGERSLRAERASIRLVRSGVAPRPAQVDSGDVGYHTEGLLVRVRGKITRVGKPSIRLDDGTGEARVRVADSTGIRWPSPHKHDGIVAVGVVSSFNGSYRILTRYDDDLSLKRQQPPTPRRVTVREARAAADGSLLLLEGVVSVPPGPLGSTRMYVQDSTAGILISSVRDGTNLRSGDRVRIVGEAGSSYGERRVRVKAGGRVQMLGHGSPPRPTRVSLSRIGFGLEGTLVRIEGTVAATVWPSVYLVHSPRAVRVYARKSAGLENPHTRQGDTLRAIGVVSGYEGAYRVLPFHQSHLHLTPAPKRQKHPSRARHTDHRPWYRIVSIAQARSATEGTRLLIQGRVTAPPGVLGQRLMYLQDGTGGILVTGDLPQSSLGEVVQVAGEAGTYHSERRLSADRTTILYQSTPVDATPLATLPPQSSHMRGAIQVGASTEGRLVSVSGQVSSSGWPSLYLDGDSLRLYARPTTSIPNPRARRHDTASAVGIVSQWDGSYRLLLRFPSDLSVAHAPRTRHAQTMTWRDVTLDQVRALPLGTRVRFEAQVTAPPGVLGVARTYVGTSDAGVALHLPGGGYPALAEGDRVRVHGTIDTYHRERIVRLSAGSDAVRLGAGAPLQPATVRSGDTGPYTEGRLVAIRARITRRQWPALDVDDGSGETRVRVLDTTSIPRMEGGKGDVAVVTGIVSQWDGRWRILPRWASDLHIVLIPSAVPHAGGGGEGEVTEKTREPDRTEGRSIQRPYAASPLTTPPPTTHRADIQVGAGPRACPALPPIPTPGRVRGQSR